VRDILCQAQAAAPLPPQQQEAPQRRRRRRAGIKGLDRRKGRRRYRPEQPTPTPPPAVWRPWGQGGRVVRAHELTKDKVAQKLVWGTLLDMPKLLQREAAVGWLPSAQATELERVRAWQLGSDDPTGTPVVGGWAFTGSVLTDGVSLCVKLVRPQGHGELLAEPLKPLHRCAHQGRRPLARPQRARRWRGPLPGQARDAGVPVGE
jgi:hypothetical protein